MGFFLQDLSRRRLMIQPLEAPPRVAVGAVLAQWPMILATVATAAVVFCGTASSAIEDRPPPTLKEVADAIGRHFAEIRSLSVSYTVKAQGLGPPGILKQSLRLVYFSDDTKVYAFKGDKRYQSEVSKPELDRVIADDVEPSAATQPGDEPLQKAIQAQLDRASQYGKRVEKGSSTKMSLDIPVSIVAFNGQVLRRKHPTRNMADVLPTSRLETDEQWFHQDYPRSIGLVLPDLFNAKNDHKDLRLPDAFSQGDYRVEPATEPVDGHPCVVVSWPGRWKYWLDPAARFAIRQSEEYDPETHELGARRHNFDLAEIGGVWLPKRCWFDVCGRPAVTPPAYRGKPLLRYVLTVSKLDLNNVPDSLFDLNIDAGMRVMDRTAEGPGGDKQVVSYIMPANKSQLIDVIREAQEEISRQDRGSGHRSMIVWAYLVIVVAALAVWAVLSIRRRSGPKRPAGPKGGGPGQEGGSGS
jgi:hypothetical protein